MTKNISEDLRDNHEKIIDLLTDFLEGETSVLSEEDAHPLAIAMVNNLPLIAAVYDLLAACKMALEEGDDYIAIKALKEAIAKAEGIL